MHKKEVDFALSKANPEEFKRLEDYANGCYHDEVETAIIRRLIQEIISRGTKAVEPHKYPGSKRKKNTSKKKLLKMFKNKKMVF